jgi:hypothetical protein
MSPQIDIDGDLFQLLQTNAEPLIDTPNSVLRRLLKLDKAPTTEEASAPRPRSSNRRGKTKRRRAPSESLLPESEYELPILQVLLGHGGRAASREVIAEVGDRVKGKLKPMDFQAVSSGTIRWENRVHFCRLRLIERGLLKKGSPRGVWEITREGEDLASRLD